MPGRKVRDEVEAQQLLAEVKQCGEELVDVCHRRNVDARSLHAWKMNLTRRRQRAGQRVAPRLVELVVPREEDTEASLFRVSHGDFTVEFDEEVDGEALRKVLWAVSTC